MLPATDLELRPVSLRSVWTRRGLLLLAPLIVYWPIFFGGLTVSRNALASRVPPEVVEQLVGWPVLDSLASAQQDEAWLIAIRRSLQRGELLLFNRWNGLGAPLLESLQPGVLYPGNLLLLLLPADSPWLFDLFSLVHVWVLELGLYWLLRCHVRPGWAAALAIMTALSGLSVQNLNMVHFRGFVWLPWMLGAVTRLIHADRQDIRSLRIGCGGLGLATVLSITAGNLQDSVFSLFTVLLVSGAETLCVWQRRRTGTDSGANASDGTIRPILLSLARIGATLMVAMAVSAPAYLPYVSALRQGDLFTVASPDRCLQGVPLTWMATWLIPHLNGLFPQQLIRRDFWEFPQTDFTTSGCLLVCLASVIAFWRQRPSGVRSDAADEPVEASLIPSAGRFTDERWPLRVYLLCALVWLLKTWHLPIFDWLQWVPLANGLKFPKYNLALHLLLTVAAAIGLRLFERLDRAAQQQRLKWCFTLMGLLLGGLLLALHQDRRWELKHALHARVYWEMWHLIGCSLGTAVVMSLWLWSTSRNTSLRCNSSTAWGLLFVVQATALVPPGWCPRMDRIQNPLAIGARSSADQDARKGESRARPPRIWSRLRPNTNLLFDLEQISVFDPILNRRYRRFFNGQFDSQYADFSLYQSEPIRAAQLPALQLLGVERIEGYRGLLQQPDLEQIGLESYRLKNALPRVFILSDEEFRRLQQAATSMTVAELYSELQTVLRRTDQMPESGSAAAMTAATTSRPRIGWHWELERELVLTLSDQERDRKSQAGHLVCLQAHASSWSWNGQRAVPFLDLFLSWPIPAAAEWPVRLVYWPVGLTAGFWIAGCGVGLALLGLSMLRCGHSIQPLRTEKCSGTAQSVAEQSPVDETSQSGGTREVHGSNTAETLSPEVPWPRSRQFASGLLCGVLLLLPGTGRLLLPVSQLRFAERFDPDRLPISTGQTAAALEQAAGVDLKMVDLKTVDSATGIDLSGPVGGAVLLRGWAIDQSAQAVPQEVYVELVHSSGQRRRFRAVLGEMRDDVRDRFGVTAYHRAGWICSVPVDSAEKSSQAAGRAGEVRQAPVAEEERVELRIVTAEGRSVEQVSTGVRLRLRPFSAVTGGL